MPPLTDMKLSRADRGTEGSPVAAPELEEEQYSYGLCIRLEKPELKKLGIDDPMKMAGKDVNIAAVGKVTNVHISMSEGNRGDSAISIQITKLLVE